MLSIVKMDLDSDSGSLDLIDEAVIKEEVEEFPINQEPSLEEYVLSFDKLGLKPIVYTTRLDDMTVLKSNLLLLHPQDLTEEILKESKPNLYINPISNDHRRSKKSFRSVKTKLHQIYHEHRRINLEEEELDIKPDIQLLPIDPSLIKDEVPDEPNSNCKFSEILNQCRPCSIELSKITFFKTKLKEYRPEIEIWAEVTIENGKQCLYKVNNSTVPTSILHRSKVKKNEKVQSEKSSIFTGHRLLTNGIMELPDPYSEALNMYGTDPRGQLIDFYTDDSAKNADKYDHIRTMAEARLAFFKSCCWIRRDEYLQSLYPKVILYTTLRFMKTPHLCPPGECVCCCKKKEHFDKPDIDFTEYVSLPNPPAYLKPDKEIKASHNDIQNDIIQINKTPGLNSSDWLRNLLSRPDAKLPYHGKGPVKLIDKALTYKPPIPKKQYDNRHLVTIKQVATKSGGIIIFRNFACDEREIYELDSNGELQSYTKSTCFNNKSEPNMKKMLQKSKSVHDVCCWFKRENVITELLKSKSLQPSVVKFIRTRHTCLSENCICCCQPKYDRGTTLIDVTFPSQPNYRASILKGVVSEPEPPITMSQAAAVVPPMLGLKVVLPTMSVAKPTITSGLGNLNNAYINPTYTPPAPAASTSSFEPVPGPSSIIKTTTKNDDDCEIVSVTPASTMPTQTNSVPIEKVRYNPEMVNCDVISEEVNSTIASILERFKDVRLTINSTGKVTAAINTPINTLSSIEIKVLASILSYAQSQVNLLGINSDMSLSSLISQTSNINNITQPESSGTTSENNFKTNSQIHPQSSDVSNNNSINNTETTNCVDYSNALPQMQLPPRTENVYEHFSISASVKNQGFNDSFTSFLATKTQNSTNSFKPVIANVFSLKDHVKSTQNDTSTSTVWYRKPGSQTSSVLIDDKTKKPENVSKKRHGDNTDKTRPKRLRVVSPSKLGAPTADKLNKLMNTFYKPIEVLDPNAEQNGNRTGIIPALNPKPVTVVSGKTLVVAPLSTANADANVVGEVTVPVAVDSEALEASPMEMSPVQAYDEASLDDDCILGM